MGSLISSYGRNVMHGEMGGEYEASQIWQAEKCTPSSRCTHAKMHMRFPRDTNHCALDPCPQPSVGRSKQRWLEHKVVFGKDAAVSAGRLEVNKIAGSHLSRDRREARVHGVPLLPLPVAFRGTAFQSREQMNTKS